jgi:hypothetical protein
MAVVEEPRPLVDTVGKKSHHARITLDGRGSTLRGTTLHGTTLHGTTLHGSTLRGDILGGDIPLRQILHWRIWRFTFLACTLLLRGTILRTLPTRRDDRRADQMARAGLGGEEGVAMIEVHEFAVTAYGAAEERHRGTGPERPLSGEFQGPADHPPQVADDQKTEPQPNGQ